MVLLQEKQTCMHAMESPVTMHCTIRSSAAFRQSSAKINTACGGGGSDDAAQAGGKSWPFDKTKAGLDYGNVQRDCMSAVIKFAAGFRIH